VVQGRLLVRHQDDGHGFETTSLREAADYAGMEKEIVASLVYGK
jgi:hypothetical protein